MADGVHGAAYSSPRFVPPRSSTPSRQGNDFGSMMQNSPTKAMRSPAFNSSVVHMDIYNQQAQQRGLSGVSSRQQHNSSDIPLNHISQYSGHSSLDRPLNQLNEMGTEMGGCENWQKAMEIAQITRSSKRPHYHAHMAVQSVRNQLNNPTPVGDGSTGNLFSRDPAADDSASSVKSNHQDGTSDGQKQDWTALDVSGIGVRNLSMDLFRYSFLTHLHVAHNKLQKITPEIASLKSLVHLDLSDNQLTSLPAEMGTMISLKQLLLFDNQLTSIPYEFGFLFKLEILGIEGNPIPAAFRQKCMDEGTAALIVSLRDACPVPLPPPEREWRVLEGGEADGDEGQEGAKAEKFLVFSNNILCNKLATPQMYKYTPSWALAWSYRKELILRDMQGYMADIICLQEVDAFNFDEYFAPQMATKGYKGVYYAKSRARTMNENERRVVDGCATFYKADKFNLLDKHVVEFNQATPLKRDELKLTHDMYNRVMTKDNVCAVTLLESKQTGARLVVSNVHMHWDHVFRDVKVVQAAMLMDELTRLLPQFSKAPSQIPSGELESRGVTIPDYTKTKLPTIVCGDFNSTPDSGVCEFLGRGSIQSTHEDFMDRQYGDYMRKGRTHSFNLKSAYGEIGELPFTNYTPDFVETIDYLWHTTPTLEVTGLLDGVDLKYFRNVVGLPNAHYPSDHLCLLAEFKFKQPS